MWSAYLPWWARAARLALCFEQQSCRHWFGQARLKRLDECAKKFKNKNKKSECLGS
jgi:hypothetical protein